MGRVKVSPKDRVITLAVREYKGYHILIQSHGNMFQYIIFHDGNFYSAYNIITESGRWTNEKLEKASDLCLDEAIATIETLIHKDNPEELVKEHEKEATIVDFIERNIQKPSN